MIVKVGMRLKVKSAHLIHPDDEDAVSLTVDRVAGRTCKVHAITPASDRYYHDMNGFCTAIHVRLDDEGRRVWMPPTWFESPCMFKS